MAERSALEILTELSEEIDQLQGNGISPEQFLMALAKAFTEYVGAVEKRLARLDSLLPENVHKSGRR